MTDTFTCSFCGETFDKGRPDADALAEAADRYGPQEDLAVVCEDCFRRMDAAYPWESFEEDRAAGVARQISLPDLPRG